VAVVPRQIVARSVERMRTLHFGLEATAIVTTDIDSMHHLSGQSVPDEA